MSRRIGVLLAALVAMLVVFGTSVSASTRHTASTARYWPPLLDQFDLKMKMVGPTSVQITSGLQYSGGGTIDYPQLRPHDVIPGMRVTLYLPKGIHVVKSKFVNTPPNNGVFYPRVPASNYKWSLKSGHPTWIFYKLDPRMGPAWIVVVNMPATMKKLTVGAVATAVGVPNAPAQKATTYVARLASQ